MKHQPIESRKYEYLRLCSSKISSIKILYTRHRVILILQYDSCNRSRHDRIRNTYIAPRIREIFKTNQKRKTYTCHSRFSKHVRGMIPGIDSTKSFSIQTMYFPKELIFFPQSFKLHACPTRRSRRNPQNGRIRTLS